jgi:monofunctional biosynthetic peptidoglycan transglycosylase
LRVVKRIALVLVLIPLVLTPLYAFVAPISTLMIYKRLVHGPIDRQWVPLDRIAKPLVAAVVMSEDGRYCGHGGVDWAELNKVLDDPDGPPRGASTIAMQTARNLFLWPGRQLVRKAMEVPIAYAISLVWSKRRLVEVYLNIAQWGPAGEFGAEAAAQRAFRKGAGSLSQWEASLLAASLPNPVRRNAARPGPGLRQLAASANANVNADGGAAVNCLGLRR